MTPCEEMQRFKIGIEMGLYNLDDLSSFLDKEMTTSSEIPYIYIDVALVISHGIKPVLNCIFQNLSDERYTEVKEPDCLVERYILGDIYKNCRSGKISLKQTCELLYKLSLYFEPYSAMNAIYDYYELAQVGTIYSSPILAQADGTFNTIDNFTRTFEAVLKRANIRPCGIHTLRHTFATQLIAKNTDVKIVSSLLGHSSVEITYNIYVHALEETTKKALVSIPSSSATPVADCLS